MRRAGRIAVALAAAAAVAPAAAAVVPAATASTPAAATAVPAATASTPVAATAAPAAAAGPPAAAAGGGGVSLGGCSWPFEADPGVLNVAFPDTGARYWVAPFVAFGDGAPVRMRIRGRFPLARYLSFHLYALTAPVDALADVEIEPANGVNPFRPGARRAERGSYELDVALGPRPARPRPNTLYAALPGGGPLPAGLLVYRLYLPEGDDTGGAGLPELRLVVDGMERELALPLSCPRLAGDSLLNPLLAELGLPLGADAQPATPAWEVGRSSDPLLGAGGLNLTGLLFPNLHNAYLRVRAPRTAGEVLAFRAKAPTFPGTRGAETMGSGEVRYWSVCSNDFLTTRVLACLADEDVAVDDDGWFTVVVSDRARRPRTLRATDNWLPAGPFPFFHVLYRHLLPDPAFAGAIQRVADPRRPQDSMGDHHPDTRLCSRAAFEEDRCGLP